MILKIILSYLCGFCTALGIYFYGLAYGKLQRIGQIAKGDYDKSTVRLSAEMWIYVAIALIGFVATPSVILLLN